MEVKNNIEGLIVGDCLDVLAGVEDESVQLIITSPPYADSRKKTYGGIHPDEYVKWFEPRAEQFLRILTKWNFHS